MEAIQLSTKAGWPDKKQGQSSVAEKEKITLASLSLMTGFPTEFIKKELMLDTDEVSMEDLRSRMGDFLQNNKEQLD